MRVVSFSVPAWFPSYEEPGAEEQAPREDVPGAAVPDGSAPDGCRPVDAQLTEQESAVFLCLATGASNRELADELQLSVSTVKFHVVNIRAKLGGISRLQACLLAALAREDTRRAEDATGDAEKGPAGDGENGLSDDGGATARR
ncbi:response regulator transcription factor [Streptomyces sp. NC-S4]